jgi:hypothetical protein
MRGHQLRPGFPNAGRCYLDMSAEAHRRLEAHGGVPPLPPNPGALWPPGSEFVSVLRHSSCGRFGWL